MGDKASISTEVLTVTSCRFSVTAIKWQLESRLHHNHGRRD